MLQTFKKKLWNAKTGFTLIELLVVIAIIGVLASIVLASLNNARQKSRDARRITDIKQIQLALELYFDGAGVQNYPVSNATCGAADPNGLQPLQTQGYIPTVPRDPSAATATNCYRYATAALSRTTYHLGTMLEDYRNTALVGDVDAAAVLVGDFSGLSGGTADSCNATAETAQPGGGAGEERCYDVTP